MNTEDGYMNILIGNVVCENEGVYDFNCINQFIIHSSSINDNIIGRINTNCEANIRSYSSDCP